MRTPFKSYIPVGFPQSAITSVTPDEPDSAVTLSNDGKGYVLWWKKASFWEFENDICSVYCSDKEHTKEFLIMSFCIMEQEVA